MTTKQHSKALRRLHDLVMDTDCRARRLRIRTNLICDRLSEANDAAGGAEDGWLRPR